MKYLKKYNQINEAIEGAVITEVSYLLCKYLNKISESDKNGIDFYIDNGTKTIYSHKFDYNEYNKKTTDKILKYWRDKIHDKFGSYVSFYNAEGVYKTLHQKYMEISISIDEYPDGERSDENYEKVLDIIVKDDPSILNDEELDDEILKKWGHLGNEYGFFDAEGDEK
jgi:hypothetical protein